MSESGPVLYRVVPCYAVLCCAVLCRVVLCCVALRCAAEWSGLLCIVLCAVCCVLCRTVGFGNTPKDLSFYSFLASHPPPSLPPSFPHFSFPPYLLPAAGRRMEGLLVLTSQSPSTPSPSTPSTPTPSTPSTLPCTPSTTGDGWSRDCSSDW